MKKKQHNKINFSVVATDVVCFRMDHDKLKALIGKAPAHSPFPGQWALIGGMVRPEETAEDTVSRLLSEKVGIKNMYTEQVHTFSGIDRDPRGRVVSIAHLALLDKDTHDISSASLETKWVFADAVPHLVYDHDEIFKKVFQNFKSNIFSTNTARYLINKEFTLSELQKVYEAVLGEVIDKRNFRKRILSSSILKDLKRKKKIGVMRPAALYTFKS